MFKLESSISFQPVQDRNNWSTLKIDLFIRVNVYWNVSFDLSFQPAYGKIAYIKSAPGIPRKTIAITNLFNGIRSSEENQNLESRQWGF